MGTYNLLSTGIILILLIYTLIQNYKLQEKAKHTKEALIMFLEKIAELEVRIESIETKESMAKKVLGQFASRN